MVVADATADGSNEATITIEPPLITALADDSVVTYDNVPFTVHLINDIQEFGTVGADKDGNVFHKGVEQPDLKGTLPPTKVDPKKKTKRRTKEQILIDRHNKKKQALKKAIKKQKDFLNHNFGG